MRIINTRDLMVKVIVYPICIYGVYSMIKDKCNQIKNK